MLYKTHSKSSVHKDSDKNKVLFVRTKIIIDIHAKSKIRFLSLSEGNPLDTAKNRYIVHGLVFTGDRRIPPHKGLVTRWVFPCDDVIMYSRLFQIVPSNSKLLLYHQIIFSGHAFKKQVLESPQKTVSLPKGTSNVCWCSHKSYDSNELSRSNYANICLHADLESPVWHLFNSHERVF